MTRVYLTPALSKARLSDGQGEGGVICYRVAVSNRCGACGGDGLLIC